MSVIAASVKEGVMAADRLCFDGDEHFPIRKVFRIRGALVGLAGNMHPINEAVKWMRAGWDQADMPKGDVVALILSPHGLKSWSPVDGLVAVPSQFAVGTGGACARAAMMAGADVRKAVQITTKVHLYCGGGVACYRLKG